MQRVAASACLLAASLTGCTAFAESGDVTFHLKSDLAEPVDVVVEWNANEVLQVRLGSIHTRESMAVSSAVFASGGHGQVNVLDLTNGRQRQAEVLVDGRTYVAISFSDSQIGITGGRLTPLYN